MEDGSDNELDESLLSTMKKKILRCARDGTDVVISYGGSSTNRELQTCYEHLRIVKEILINLLKPTGYVMHQQFNIQQL
jgi:hypothetical protein